jgi:cyclopropane fatty-acyl-phospholipid synthase-like methyltransferase
LKNIFSIFKKKKSVTAENVPDTFLQDESILVGYSNINEQIITYSTALTFFNPNLSILDVGCGRGDLFAFMKEQYEDVFLDSNYYGIDNNEIVINAGKQKYNINNIHLQNFNSFKTDVKYNWVIALNYFNEPVEDKYKSLYNTVDKLFNTCTDAVVFNVITNQADIQQDQESLYSIYDAGQILNHLTTVYKKVIVRADYLLGDTMFYVFKK